MGLHPYEQMDMIRHSIDGERFLTFPIQDTTDIAIEFVFPFG